MEKTITYGLSKLYYALQTMSGYSVLKAMPGAVKISLTPETYKLNFTGLDCIPRENGSILYGYKGTIIVAGITADFYKDVYRYVDSANSLVEYETAEVKPCALIFETDGIVPERHCYYNCTFDRADFNSETKTDKTSISTVSIPVIMRADSNKRIKKINSDITSAEYINWFEAVT